MTQYTDLVSQNKHLVRGRAYPSVVVLDSTIAAYWRAYPDSVDPDPRLKQANLDVLKQVVPALGSGVFDFDLNGDDYLDYVYIFYRAVRNATGQALNFRCLGDSCYYFNALSIGFKDSTFIVDGRELHVGQETGAAQFPLPINVGEQVRSRAYTFQHFVHEYGHDLGAVSPPGMWLGDHLMTTAGYCIMDGSYTGFTYPSAFFVDQMKWITPVEIDSTSGDGDTTIVLQAVPDGGAYARIRTRDPSQYFLLELRNRALPYAQGPQGALGCRSSIDGWIGLLITHVLEGGAFTWNDSQGRAPLVDPEAATGMFTTSGAPDPVTGKDKIQALEEDTWTTSQDDLLPNVSSLFAPYTNPNSNLYAFENGDYRRAQDVKSGITIEGVTLLGEGPDSVSVRIRYQPSGGGGPDTLAANTTWNRVVQLSGDLVVPEGVTLTLEPPAQVYVRAADDRFASGADTSRSELVLHGSLQKVGTGPIRITSSREAGFTHWESGEDGGEDTPAAPGDWFGIRMPEQSHVQASSLEVRYAGGAFAFDGDPVAFPDFAALLQQGYQFLDNVSDVSFARDVTIRNETVTIPAGWKIGFSAGGDLGRGGLDSLRVEALLEEGGRLVLAGTPAAPVYFGSDASAPSGGQWYGVRTPDLSRLEGGYVSIQGARGALALEREPAVLPSFSDLTGRGFSFSNNTTDVSFDRDLFVPADTETIPAGWRIGFAANRDASGSWNAGVDSARAELVLGAGSVLAVQGTASQYVTFCADDPSAGPGAWYGVRTPDLSQIQGDHLALRQARGALALEPDPPVFPDIAGLLLRGFIFSDNITDVSFDRDVAVPAETRTIPAGWRIGFTAHRDSSNGGRDPKTVELILNTPGSSLSVQGTGRLPVTFSSDDPSAGAGAWYGIRTSDLSRLEGSFLIVKQARGALALEQDPAVLPDFANLTSRSFDLTENVCDVSFDRDLAIAAADTIPAGWRLGFTAHHDGGRQGADSTLAELIVEDDGQLVAIGTTEAPVAFMADSVWAAADSWFGIRFDLTGTAHPAYGYVGSVQPSRLERTVIKDAKDAVSIENVIAPTLIGVTFENTEPEVHLKEPSVYLPFWWHPHPDSALHVDPVVWELQAPTRVIVAPGQNTRLTVHGRLATQGSESSRVYFGPAVGDSLYGGDWQGITIRGVGLGYEVGRAELSFAEIAFARYPVSFFLADTSSITDSWIHHYHDEGITDAASDAAILRNVIWRGAGMSGPDSLVGRVGIHIATSFGTYRENQVFHQMQKGIWADFGSGLCSAPPTQHEPRILDLSLNDVIGDRLNFDDVDASGIEVSWACRYRNVTVDSCNVQNWPRNGIKLRQSSDVGVSCNCVKGNGAGVFHRRDNLAYSPPDSLDDGYSWLEQNLLKQNDPDNVMTYGKGPAHESYPPPDNPNTSGLNGGGPPGQRQAGRNLFEAITQLSNNWHVEAYEYRVDWARHNGWRDHLGEPLTTESTIDEFNWWDDLIQDIDVTDFDPAAPPPGCVDEQGGDCDAPSAPGEGAGRTVQAGSMRTRSAGYPPESDEQPSASIEREPALPTVLALHGPRPNPATQGVDMQLDVPAPPGKIIRIRVYDVRGRRVRTLLSGAQPPGRLDVHWDLRDQAGRRVGAGVYFARMESGNANATHRIVVLQ